MNDRMKPQGIRRKLRYPGLFLLVVFRFGCHWVEAAELVSPPFGISEFLTSTCLDCHSGSEAEGGLDFEKLGLDVDSREAFERWLLIHDRVRNGEMPPPDDGIPKPIFEIGSSEKAADAPLELNSLSESQLFLTRLATSLVMADRQRIADSGRAKVRRLNRFEYENTLRTVLNAPWLQVADLLPEDGVAHLFNKAGERLDTSHVQLMRWLSTANQAVQLSVNAAAYPSESRKSYARDEPVMHNYVRYRFGQTAATRSIVPLLDTMPEPDVIRGSQPMTVGDADPEKREREAMGVFSGVYSATTKYDFTNVLAPTDGLYRVRFKTYTFRAGANGADDGPDHGLTGGKREWWRPDRGVAFPGDRSEPITLYALAASGDSRWLTTFDSQPEPSVFETVVALKTGEGIRPDAARLVRTRPGWAGNPNATPQSVPGFAMNWLELNGPMHDSWPPPSYQSIFGDLPFDVSNEGQVKAISQQPLEDGRRLINQFYRRAVLENETDVYSA